MLVNGLLREQFGFYALCVLVGERRSESFLTQLFFLHHSFNFFISLLPWDWIWDVKM